MTTTIRTLYISTSEPPVVLSKLLDPGTLLNLIGGAPQSVHAVSEWQLYLDRDAQRKDAPVDPAGQSTGAPRASHVRRGRPRPSAPRRHQ
ncbi:hypothetical protein GCM10027569_67370 [Flindersiella endophytica]